MSRSGKVLATSVVTVAAAALAPAAMAAPTAPTAAAAKPGTHVVVVSHLNNPRQLSLVGRDELLIAEAGRGGSKKVSTPDGSAYVGATGSISAVFLPQYAHGTSPRRIVRGLLSGSGDPSGAAATGSDGVSSRSTHGPIYIAMTYAPPDVLPKPFGSRQDGRLLSARPYRNRLRSVADLASYERTHDPDGYGFDSNPYAVLARKHNQLVADAAGNDVLAVRHGRVSVFHVFANVTSGACAKQYDPDKKHPGCNYVPTSLATDRWGHVYVGGLVSGVPGQGRVTELSADGKHVLRVWTGFSAVTGVAVGRDGAVYVSQAFAKQAKPFAPGVQGVLTHIAHGVRTSIDVPFPAGVAVDGANRVYVVAWSIATSAGSTPPGGKAPVPGTSGQVWRLHS